MRGVGVTILAAGLITMMTNSGLDSLDGRQWDFRTDMNGDGRLTIRDVTAITGWLFFYPGDFAIYCLRTYLKGFSEFFEITPNWYGKLLSFLVSLVGWPIVAFLLYGLTALPEVAYERISSWRKNKNE